MSASRRTIALLSVLSLSGCGTYVPEIQEFPIDAPHGQIFVEYIIQNITCEVQDAVYDLYQQEKLVRNLKQISFLDSWGVQISLTFTIDEKGSLSPSANLLPPSPVTSVFNLGLGATVSSEATRIDKFNSFFLVSELRKSRCPDAIRQRGPFLLESDLKLEEWLDDTVQASATGYVSYPATNVNGPFKSNVLSHEVKFEVVSSGNATPGWKLTRATVNQSGNLLTASRDRTHDLLIVFGPAAATTTTIASKHGKAKSTTYALATPAANAELASEIGIAVSNGVKNALQP